MARRITPLRLVLGALGLLALAALILWLTPSSSYLLLPDVAHPVAPLVRVQGAVKQQAPGGIYFVDVFERRANELESLFPFMYSGATLVPANLIVPPGVSDRAVRRADLREMAISQQVAAAVALRRLGYDVVAQPAGVIVDAVDEGTHAPGKLEPADVIHSVDGKPTPTVAGLRRALGKVRPGATVALGVARGGKRLVVRIKTVALGGRAIVGIEIEQAARIRLPLRVQIDAGNVGGPSAGLAFALEVMEKLGRDVDRGYKVAATGQIELDGGVAPIGGVEQKTYGARAAKVDVFLVPAGDNYRTALRYAHGLRIIAVRSFPQALQALAALPRRG